MAIRTMIRGLVEKLRTWGAVRPSRTCLAFSAAILLVSFTAAADYAAGLTAFNRKEYARAFSEWIEGAKAGDAHAQHGLGMLYELGQGVPYADPKAAADWYQKAAAQNYAPALNNLARLYADGRGIQQDVPKAIELWSKAAEGGNITARFNLGLQYASGAGVPKDMKKAASFMLQAAENGLPEAQFAVASYYRDGTGVEKDLDAARLWYQRAATAGFEPARAELGALDKPAVSPTPAVQQGEAAPAAQQAEAGKAETPPPPSQETEAVPAERPAAGQPPDSRPAEPSPSTVPPANELQQADDPPPSEAPAHAALTDEPPSAVESSQTAEAQQPPQSAPERPADEVPAAMGAQDSGSDLPVADSLTGDEQVYRIWLYESGQEGDARSYWDKLRMQHPGLLKNLQLDLRRYFLGEAKGSLYRVFAGPFDDLGAARRACEDFKQRFGDQFCRPVLN